jgi:hypothetical protein
MLFLGLLKASLQPVMFLAENPHRNDEIRSAQTPDWLNSKRFALFLALFIIAGFPDVIIGTGTFFFRDFGSYGYPVAAHLRNSFLSGEFPLWNPYNHCGLPFFAQWSTLAAYPFSLFYVLFPISWALGVFCLAHLWWGGMGMYWLVKELTGNRLAGGLAGVTYCFSGFVLNAIMWPHYTVSLSWAPLVVLTARRTIQNGISGLVPAVLAGSMQMVAGPPEVIISTWLLVGCFFLADLKRTTVVQRAARVMAVIALITALSSIQLLPFFALLQQSHREAGFSQANWAMPLTGWINYLLPLFGMNKTAMGNFLQPNQGVTSSYYFALLGTLIAVLSFFLRPNRLLVLLGSFLLLTQLLAFGEKLFVYKFLADVFPGISVMRYPVKFILPSLLIVPICAGYLLAKWSEKQEGNRRDRILITSCIIISLIVLGVVGATLLANRSDTPGQDLLTNAVLRLVFLWGAALCLQRIWTERTLQPAKLVLIFLALVALDGLTHLPNQNPRVSRAAYDLKASELGVPKPELGQGRIHIDHPANEQVYSTLSPSPMSHYLTRRAATYANHNLLDRIPKTDGFFSLYLKHERELREHFASVGSVFRGYLDFVGVSHLYTIDQEDGKKVFAWKSLPTPLPLATIGRQPIWATNTLQTFLAESFNPHENVVLPYSIKEQISHLPEQVTNARVSISKISAHQIKLQVGTERPAILSIAQAWGPEWTATLNSQRAQLLKINHAFQGMIIPPGSHEVILQYKSSAFEAGKWISLCTLFFLGFYHFAIRQRSSNQTPTASSKPSAA